MIDKDLDPERAKEVLDIAERLQMRSTASLIVGFPEEEWDDVRDTVRIFMHSARCSRSRPQLNILAPLAGTPIHEAHRHELVLDDLCSDMSHQGLTQNEEDLELIRSYRDIFPNFYMIPAKGLDRDVLFDLREFLSMAVECFRWMLCSIDQAMDLLDFHGEWRCWRLKVRGDLIGSDLRRYYAGRQFRYDFLQFVGEHRLLESPSILALVRVEETMKAAGEAREREFRDDFEIATDETLQMDDVPQCGRATRTLDLEYNLEEIVWAIANGTEPKQHGAMFYATRVDDMGVLRLVEISRWLAAVIKACDGRQTVAKVLDRLGSDLREVEEEARSYVGERLLVGARTAGFVDIRRGGRVETQNLVVKDSMTTSV